MLNFCCVPFDILLHNIPNKIDWTYSEHCIIQNIQNCYIIFCSEESKEMVKISIQAAHEQINPTDLLNDVIIMDKNGIERCWSSDHYMPWWHTGASGAAAWPWIGAALAKTSNIVIGTGVTAPILGYH